MTAETLWYGGALVLGLIAPYLLATLELWELCIAQVPLGKRAARAVMWGVIYTALAFAFCIDIAGVPVRKDWGLVILVSSTVCSALFVRVREKE